MTVWEVFAKVNFNIIKTISVGIFFLLIIMVGNEIKVFWAKIHKYYEVGI